jgi:hypothetical protein
MCLSITARPVTKKNPKRIDAWGVASMCELETEQQGGAGGWGAAQSRLAANTTLKHK